MPGRTNRTRTGRGKDRVGHQATVQKSAGSRAVRADLAAIAAAREALGPSGAWRLVNRVQIAALLAVHPDSVTAYARQGMPVVTRGGSGKESAYDAVECLAWQRKGLGKNAKDAAQAASYEATAQMTRIKVDRELGRLLPRDQVIGEGQAFVKALSAKIAALPRVLVLSGVLPSEQEAAAAACCRDLLTQIAGWKTVADLRKAAA